MATVNEAAGSGLPLEAALKAGLDNIDYGQSLTFKLYVRVVLPFDGFAYWVRAELLTPAAWNDVLAEADRLDDPPKHVVEVKGALHYSTEVQMQEDNNLAINKMIFTSMEKIQDFLQINPAFLYVGEFEGIRFAFSSRGSYFQQANLHHYFGIDVDPTIWDLLIDDPADMPADEAIVSNSLPIWLYLNGYAPAWHVDIPMPAIPLWPSYLAGANITPPFGTVHIDPDQTIAYQSAPLLGRTLEHSQLMHDRVVVTLFGCTNKMALDFLDAVNQFTLDTGYMGIVGVPPAVRDDKKTQPEYLWIAKKKRIVFEVSYHQYTARNIARQLIEKAIVSIFVGQTQISGPVATPA
jgi:hypothetical protein